MKYIYRCILFICFPIVLKSCDQNGKSNVHYNKTVVIMGDTISDSLSLRVENSIIDSDTLFIRFLVSFENDCVEIFQEDSLIIRLDSLYTNNSTMLAREMVVFQMALFPIFSI